MSVNDHGLEVLKKSAELVSAGEYRLRVSVDGMTVATSGTRASPNLVSTTIPISANQWLKVYIAGSGAPVVDPAIADGTGANVLILFSCSDTNTVELNDAANLQLSGKWVGVDGSMLELHWDGASKWVERGRNEI